MYTQCPDCSTAFRVTATVLKQAAGKVRCGGCGNAFNALAYLSESMPEQPAANDVEEQLPELKPEPLENNDGLPASISAEQSAALLKTLDELAGSDIRIEDTGVEWRVLDEEELGESPVDEVLEDSPTPVDQFLTDTPAQIDSPEIFQEDANAPAQTPVDELRFDDNTPLPDDFDFGMEPPYESPSAEQPEDAEPAAGGTEDVVEKVAAEPQPDIDLSEPDEWTDILDEFDDLGAAAALPLDEELAALDEQLADEAPEEPAPETIDEPDEFQLDAPENVDDEPTIADELEAIEADTEIATDDSAGDDADVDSLLDMDTQFALQAEAMGIDLSGIHDTTDEEPAAEDEPSLDELLSTADDEVREIDDLLDEDLVDEVDFEELAVDVDDIAAIDEKIADDEAEQLDLIDEATDDPEEDPESLLDAETDEDSEALLVDEAEEYSDAQLEEEPELELEDTSEEEPADAEPEVPPLSEEEQTINMQIDAELMAIAVEDEEGFASTIIIPGSKAEEALLAEKAKEDKEDQETIDDEADEAEEAEEAEEVDEAEEALKDTSAGFETIIMEGEQIRSGLEQQYDNEEDKAAAAALIGAAAAEREAERQAASGGRRWIMILGALVLALVLALQAVHQQRDVLAKIPAFNNIAGPLYRSIGQPLAPEWDITGWRFEATKGSTDEGDENLTIYSRLGNKLDEPLPYPIIAISLTDRFEETIGSRILDPSDYLANNLDPRKLVEPGNTFNAVITITAPDPEAAGFKLNVCYRDAGGDLRCAIDDFK